MEQEKNPAWEPQADGTFLPSKELVDKVRANRSQYPNAVQDFSVITGKTEEEVSRILDNDLGYDWQVAVGHGLSNAVGWAVENTGDLLGVEGADKAGDFFRREAAFETEKSTLDKVGEVVGQAAPSVVAGIATGGTGGIAGFLTGMGVGGAVSTGTFDPHEQTVVDLIDEHVVNLGAVQEALQINDTDSPAVSMTKQFVAGALVEAATAGAFKVVGKLGSLIKGNKLKEAEQVAEEAGLGSKGGAESVQQGEEVAVTKTAAEASAEKSPVIDEILTQEAKTSVNAAVEGLPKLPVQPHELKAFSDETLNYVRKYAARHLDTSDLDAVAPGAMKELSDHAQSVYKAIREGNIETITGILRAGPKLTGEVSDAMRNAEYVYRMGVMNSTLKHTSTQMSELVSMFRADPSIRTREGITQMASDSLNKLSELWDIYRTMGSAWSYAGKVRKGVQEGLEDIDELAPLMEADREIVEELQKLGITLKDTEAEFVAKKILALDDAGINPVDLIDDLYKQFDQFNMERTGVLKGKALTKISDIEKMGWIGMWMQRAKDIQSVMLLGQLMTAGTEILSTGTHMMLLPVLKKLGGSSGSEWVKEYAGYSYAMDFAWNTVFKPALKKGRGVVDDFDIKEGTNAAAMQYENMSKPAGLAWRGLKFAVDLSVASSEFMKATRGFGVAYADGLENAIKAGLPDGAAKKAALQYARDQFTPDGAFVNADLKLRISDTAFQTAFDGSTLTGKMGIAVENIRNSGSLNGAVSVVARGALPFFRTLTDIGGKSGQMLMPPGTAWALKKFAPEGTGVAKFIDDFTGKNGAYAQMTARGRQRLGMMSIAGGFALSQMDGIEITGPTAGQRWDAQARAFEEYPSSSIIIGNQAYDLTRFLPFSAPLMLVGIMRDYQLEDQNRLQGGDYDPTEGNLEAAMRYGQALGTLTFSIMQDAGAARGLFDFFTAISQAMTDGDTSGMKRYFQSYAQQFTPGPVRMVAKAQGDFQYEGYDFWSRWYANSGFNTGYKRLDFFGKPIKYPVLKGVEPLNRRVLNLDDPAYREFAMLNRFEDLALKLDKPDRVIPPAYWRDMGIDPTDPTYGKVPSLVDMKTKDGKNAWDLYRELVYKGKAPEDTMVSLGSKDLGKIAVHKGETFEQAMRRTIQIAGYSKITSDLRKKIWTSVFGFYKKGAKDEVLANVSVGPDLFKDSRYGSPINSETSIADTRKAGKTLAAQTQSTKGTPLDELFAIQ